MVTYCTTPVSRICENGLFCLLISYLSPHLQFSIVLICGSVIMQNTVYVVRWTEFDSGSHIVALAEVLQLLFVLKTFSSSLKPCPPELRTDTCAYGPYKSIGFSLVE